MDIQVLGVGNAFTARHYNTSFLVRSKNLYLIDGPPGLFRLLKECGISRESLGRVVVTHVHGDHVAGLEALILWRRYHLNQKTRLYTTRPIFEKMQSAFFSAFRETFDSSLVTIVDTTPEDYVEWIELSEDAPTYLEEGLSVETRYNWHPTPTLGLKFTSRYGSVGISGDTCYRPRLLKALRKEGKLSEDRYAKLAGAWLWESDLIYHEADRGGEKSPHTQEVDLMALPQETRNKIRLIHLPDDFREEALPLAVEGERVVIDKTGVRPR